MHREEEELTATWRSRAARVPGERKLDAGHAFGVRSFWLIRNNQPIAMLSNVPLFLLYTHT